jgi:hypothetical protein
LIDKRRISTADACRKALQALIIVSITAIIMAIPMSCSKEEIHGPSDPTSPTAAAPSGAAVHLAVENPSWYADNRCFLDGLSGCFDDISVKDPSILNSGGYRHLFYTARDNNYWRMGYEKATRVADLKNAAHTLMSLGAGTYYCAPQVFYFSSKGKWYLMYRSNGACYSTGSTVGSGGWSSSKQMFSGGVVDYWCLSDGVNMFCFWGPNGGSHVIKRRSTSAANFPGGRGAISNVCSNAFEAPHV